MAVTFFWDFLGLINLSSAEMLFGQNRILHLGHTSDKQFNLAFINTFWDVDNNLFLVRNFSDKTEFYV